MSVWLMNANITMHKGLCKWKFQYSPGVRFPKYFGIASWEVIPGVSAK